jgi:hypothetical protein
VTITRSSFQVFTPSSEFFLFRFVFFVLTMFFLDIYEVISNYNAPFLARKREAGVVLGMYDFFVPFLY